MSIDNSFLGDNELIIDSDAENNFEDIDDSLHTNIESYTPTTSQQQTSKNNPISIIENLMFHKIIIKTKY